MSVRREVRGVGASRPFMMSARCHTAHIEMVHMMPLLTPGTYCAQPRAVNGADRRRAYM